MRLVIERGELLRALGHVTSVVERRTTIPILSNVLLRTRDSTLEFKATDLEREVIESVAADVSAPGAVTVPAHILHDIVRKLPDGSQVDIRKDAEKERSTASKTANIQRGVFICIILLFILVYAVSDVACRNRLGKVIERADADGVGLE